MISIPSQKTWLVTGVAGFIGSHLLERLLTLGQTVVGLDSFATGSQQNLDLVAAIVGPDRWKQFTFCEEDIRNREACSKIVAKSGASIILHQAALGSVPRSMEDPMTSHDVNVDGFLSMLDAARTSGVNRFVYASSSSVYGDIDDSFKIESRLGKQLSPYAVTKRTNEIYAQVFGTAYGMETVGLRYFNVFGPRQSPDGAYAAVIPRFLDALQKSKESVIYGDGTTSRDFCYVANVVQANILAGLVPRTSAAMNNFVNVACGATTSLTALWTMLRDEVAKVRGISADDIPGVKYEPFRAGDIKHSCANIELAKESLGFDPTHTVKDGLEELVRYALK